MPRTRRSSGNRDGINVCDVWAAKGQRQGKRWLYRVWDKLARKYKRRAFGDGPEDRNRKTPGCSAGDAWAESMRNRLGVGLETANSADIDTVASAYVDELRERRPPVHPSAIRNIELTAERLKAAGVRDLGDKSLRVRVQRWLGSLALSRSKGTVRDDEDEKHGSAADSTRARYLTHVRALLNHARNRGWLVGDPLQGLAVTAPDTNREVFTLDELRRIAALQARADAAWIWTMLMLYTGMRREEAATAEWQDIDWEARVIRVTKGKGRGGKRRTIFLMDEANTFLSALGGPDAKVARIGRIVPKGTASGVTWAQFRSLLKCAEVEPDRGMDPITCMPRRLSPHSCRHTFAALMLATGVDGIDLRLTLGHSAEDLTQYYAQQRDLFRRQVQGESWPRGHFRLSQVSVLTGSAQPKAAGAQ